MSTKDAVIDIIKQMPEESGVDDIMAEIYFFSKVNQGLQELDEGKGIPHEKVKERMREWLN